MQSRSNAAASIRSNHHVVIEIERLARGGLYTEVGCDAAKHHCLAASTPELQVEFSPKKALICRLAKRSVAGRVSIAGTSLAKLPGGIATRSRLQLYRVFGTVTTDSSGEQSICLI